jgi:hypothetical protein
MIDRLLYLLIYELQYQVFQLPFQAFPLEHLEKGSIQCP